MRFSFFLAVSIWVIQVQAAMPSHQEVSRVSQDHLGIGENIYFSMNSIRRNATQQEEHFILTTGSCAAFFVDNRDQRLLVATARHCFNYKMTKACEDKNNWYISMKKELSPFVGICKRVVAGTSQDDLVIIEIEFEDVERKYQSQEEVNTVVRGLLSTQNRLKLAGFTVPLYARFKMIGFPGDPERNGELTVTENCWETTGTGRYWSTGQAIAVLGGNVSNGSPDPEVRAFQNMLQRTLRWNNCSAYGGNSGGPIILEGSDIAIGLPGAFQPNVLTVHPHNVSNFYETTYGFVRRNRAALETAGITIVDQPPTPLIQTGIQQTQRWISNQRR